MVIITESGGRAIDEMEGTLSTFKIKKEKDVGLCPNHKIKQLKYIQITINYKLDQVSEFSYLGGMISTQITADGKDTQEIE